MTYPETGLRGRFLYLALLVFLGRLSSMGLQTSMYLSDDLEAAWLAAKARGETMAGVFRRGLAAPDPSAAAVAAAVRSAIGQIGSEVEDSVARGFARALRDLQSGAF